MPALAESLVRRTGEALEVLWEATELVERETLEHLPTLYKRIYIPCCNSSSPPGLVQAETVDPWQKSGKYALGWVYFCIILLVMVAALRWYNYWHDKIRTALHKEQHQQAAKTISPASDFELSALTGQSTQRFFPKEGPLPEAPKEESSASTSWPLNFAIALCRYLFYHPIPNVHYRKGWRPIIFPSLGVMFVGIAALAFVMCYCFVPQPLYWKSIRFGSPPLAVRAGMIAVAMIPWIVALSMKANFITMITGIGHERLNVLHRWAAYICLLLSLIHTIPFYITPIWDKGGYKIFRSFFTSQHFYVYGSGTLIPRPTSLMSANVCRTCGLVSAALPMCPFSPTPST